VPADELCVFVSKPECIISLMIELALNDVVMVRGVGYGLLVECGTRKSVKIRKAVEQVEAKKEQPTPSIANLFAEVATVTTETS